MERWATLRYGKTGHRWLDWFTDLERSGVTIDRPALNQARDRAVANRAAIVVYDMTRYSRSVPEGLSALERLAADDVRVLSASEDLDATTPEGELSLTMFLAMSQYQVRRIGASWRNVIERNKREGWWHGVPPYGYRRATAAEGRAVGRTAGVIVPDEITAVRVQELFRRYLAGEGLYSLVKQSMARGWFTRESSVKEVLSNSAYAGMITWADRRVRRYKEGPRAGEIQRDSHGRPLRDRIPGTEKHYCGRHEPLISARDFIRVRRRMTAEARPAYERHPTARWSAAGITKCGGCGRALNFHDKSAIAEDGLLDLRQPPVHGQGRQHPCQRTRGRPRASSAGLGERASHRGSRPSEPGAAQGAQEPSGGSRCPPRATRELNAAIARAAASRLLADVDDALSTDEIDAALGVLRTELQQVEAKLTPYEELGRSSRHELEAALDRAEDLASLWPNMTNDERVEALRALGAVVVIAPSPARRSPVAGRITLRVPWLPEQRAG